MLIYLNVISCVKAGDKDSQWRIPNVTERDFLRMEGDPSSHGYTIKEAVALARSMVSFLLFFPSNNSLQMMSFQLVNVLHLL